MNTDQAEPFALSEQKFDADAPVVLSSMWGAMPSYDKNAKFATVDAAYTGVGFPKVLFDGETTLTQKAYKYLGAKPAASARVVLEPLGGTYVITGALGQSSVPKVIHMFSVPIISLGTPTTTTPVKVAEMSVPDPGWPYQLEGIIEAQYVRQFVNNTWSLSARLDSLTGQQISMTGLGVEVGYGLQQGIQPVSYPKDSVPTLTGSHMVYGTVTRTAGVGALNSVASSAFGSMLVFMIPVLA